MRKACIDFRGYSFDTLKEMCIFYDIGLTVFRCRIENGWTLKDALTGALSSTRPTKCKDFNSMEFNSITDMCRHHRVSRTVYNERLRLGWSQKDALTKPLRNARIIKCQDHNGKEFDSVEDMCNYHGVHKVTYFSRLRSGLSQKEALTKPRDSHKIKKCQDHDGKQYDSVSDMCDYYKIPKNIYYSRLYAGWTLKDTLTKPVIERGTAVSVKCQDHKGTEFESVKAMCNYYGVSYSTYRARLESGWTLEQILNGRNKAIDHNGKEYESIADMCSHYNIPVGTYYSRLKSGYTKAQALEPDIEARTDYNGVVFESVEEMCKQHGVVRGTYYLRLKKGWTKEQALTGSQPISYTSHMSDGGKRGGNYKPCVDHDGNEFNSILAMCEYHGVKAATYISRLKRGYTLEQALTKTIYKDHRGKEFNSLLEMCEYHGLSLSTYEYRMRSGWTTEEALTGVRFKNTNK